MELLSLLSPYVSNPATIYAVAGVLVLWASWSIFWLWTGRRRLSRVLASARERLARSADAEAFSSDFEGARSDLDRLPVIGPRWAEFRETLLVPREAGRPVRSTRSPEDWFSLGMLRDRSIGIDLRYQNAMPGLLVGAGLLFTFLGLAVALAAAGGIVAEGASQETRNAALRQLLDTASFKFITSLVGLALSVVYTLMSKALVTGAERDIDRLVADIEHRMPPISPEAMQQQANEILERQSLILESFSNDLAVGIAGAIDKAFDSRLGEHIGPLTEAVQAFVGKASQGSQDTMEQMLREFTDKLHAGSGAEMAKVAETLSALGEKLGGLQAGLTDAADAISQSADAMSRRLGEGTEAALARVTDQLAGVVDSLRRVADDTRTAGAAAGAEMADRIGAAAASFESAAGAMAASLSSTMADLQRRLGEQGAEDARRLSAQLDEMVSALAALAERNREAGEAAGQRILAAGTGFAEHADVLGRRAADLLGAGDALAARIADLDRIVGDASAPLVAGAEAFRSGTSMLQDAAARMRDAAAETGRGIDQVAGVVQRFEAVQHAVQTLAGRLDESAGRFAGVDQSLAKTLGELQHGLENFAKQVATVVNSTNSDLAKAVGQLSNLVKGLEDAIEDAGLSRAPERVR
jgi:uncharacterized phage infection (PIP) family protein YhgE